jgi:thiosulfate/3-mercaptopyruvate sulfurtransferase
MGPLVTTRWLAERLDAPNLRILDGSWHLVSAGRDARAEFAAGHIPGAQFFDIDAVKDTSTDLPHMLPSPRELEEHASALGIGSGDRVVVYDAAGMFSAARVWWTFRVFGHDDVHVLDGGLPKWKRESLPIERDVRPVERRRFVATHRKELVRSLEEMRANLATHRDQVLDARSRERFLGTAPEPRAGVRGGHIPGSTSLPFGELLEADGTFRDLDGLRRAFAAAGVDLERPVTCSCGSGITASVLALGLFLAGREDAAVYDGSWSEWGARTDTPVETG